MINLPQGQAEAAILQQAFSCFKKCYRAPILIRTIAWGGGGALASLLCSSFKTPTPRGIWAVEKWHKVGREELLVLWYSSEQDCAPTAFLKQENSYQVAVES